MLCILESNQVTDIIQVKVVWKAYLMALEFVTI